MASKMLEMEPSLEVYQHTRASPLSLIFFAEKALVILVMKAVVASAHALNDRQSYLSVLLTAQSLARYDEVDARLMPFHHM